MHFIQRERFLTLSDCCAEGKMEKLDSKWILINDSQCTEKDASAATLGLTNMAGACRRHESPLNVTEALRSSQVSS